jgi:hypothetical protein
MTFWALTFALTWTLWLLPDVLSLLLVMLMHAAVNNTSEIVPSALAGSARPVVTCRVTRRWGDRRGVVGGGPPTPGGHVARSPARRGVTAW